MESTGDPQRTSEAQYGANQPPFQAEVNQVNLSSSTFITDQKGRVHMSAVKDVKRGASLLRNRAHRQFKAVRNLIIDLQEANGLPQQLIHLKSWEPEFKRIKQDIASIPYLPESQARLKLLEVERSLKQCLKLISQVRRELSKARRFQSQVHKLGEVFLNNEELSTEALENQLLSVMPTMEEIAASLPSLEALPPPSSDCDNDKGLHGMPLGNTINNGMLQQGGSEVFGAQNIMNAPPLSQSDNWMNLMLSASNKRDGELVFRNLSEAEGKDPFKMVELGNNCDIVMIPTPKAPNGANVQPSPDDNLVNSSNLMLTGPKKRNREAEGEGIKKQSRPRLTVESPNLGEENTEEHIQRYNEGTPKNKDKTALSEARVQGIAINDVIPIDQDNGSLLARKMMRREYSSWNFQHFNEDNDSFPALEQAPQVTEFLRQNIEVLVSGTIKEMQEWRTPKDSGWDQLKKWKAALNLGKRIGVEVKAAADKLENISLACFAYSMIFGEG
ncbi:hypothetical protein E1A91_D11G386200v1 [Gossypium mustelinum]|uniref:Uncharacterized protein n=1 Tax=Gossypium mustelinum TaxID=34275 RepID=A0A5D2T3S7_GOSMU|nr:hypothetical protein E1A91_D11G386200v1 [Gossypium mustelinum]